MGLGHRRRMEALAAALTERGHACTLTALPIEGLAACDAVVVDSYLLRADAPVFAAGPVVAAIDDLERDLAVALVVDPSPGALGAAHRRARRVLAGAAYALIPRPEVPVREAAIDEPVRRVLVTTGAADAAGVGAVIAGALVAQLPGAEVRLVVGPWGATDVPAGVIPVHAPDGLAREIGAAGVVVTAGGVALLEACRFGRPIVALALAANQRQAVHGLDREHAVVVATLDTVAGERSHRAGDAPRRLELATAARLAVDGRGAYRVVDILERLAASASARR